MYVLADYNLLNISFISRREFWEQIDIFPVLHGVDLSFSFELGERLAFQL